MKNQTKVGDVVSRLAPYDLLSGQGFRVGLLFAVAVTDALSGVAVEGMTQGIVTLTKLSAQAWAVGDAIYWDNINKRCTNVTGTGLLFIGVADAVAANPSATGSVRLNGSAPAALQP